MILRGRQNDDTNTIRTSKIRIEKMKNRYRQNITVMIALGCAVTCLGILKSYALLLKPGDPPPKPVPLFSRIRFNVNNYRFFVDAKMRCRYNDNDKFMYRHNHPFTSSTNVYFEIGTVLEVTDTKIIYGSSTNSIGTKSCFLIEGEKIIPGRFVPNF